MPLVRRESHSHAFICTAGTKRARIRGGFYAQQRQDRAWLCHVSLSYSVNPHPRERDQAAERHQSCRCALAAIAQFYPVKYPDNFWILVTCVGLYIATSLVSTLVLGSIEGDIFFTAREKVNSLRPASLCTYLRRRNLVSRVPC